MKTILLIADTRGWIFDRHCNEIKKRLTEYSFDIKYSWQDLPSQYNYSLYDLVYQLDPMAVGGLNPPSEKTVIGLRNEFMYSHSREGLIEFYLRIFHQKYSMMHVVNKNQYREFSSIPMSIPLMLVQHGIDTNCFKANNKKSPLTDSELVVGISGSPTSTGEKGFGIVEEACRITGCKLLTSKQNFVTTHLTKEQMAEYYNNIDVYCCMSKSEGLNNCVMEAGATSVPVITTRTGAVEEMIKDGKSGFIIERDVKSLVDKLEFFKKNRMEIESFGNELKNTIISNWSWDIRIKDYRRMFDQFFKLGKP